jgi:hypothetical protein
MEQRLHLHNHTTLHQKQQHTTYALSHHLRGQVSSGQCIGRWPKGDGNPHITRIAHTLRNKQKTNRSQITCVGRCRPGTKAGTNTKQSDIM